MHIHIHTPHTAPLKIHQGLSAWALLTFGAGNTLIRDCPVHCGMLSSISGLHPLDASSPPVRTTRNISMHCSMAPAGMLISCREPLEYDNGRGIRMEWDTFPHLLILDLQAPYSTRQCLLTVGACTSSADPFPKHAAICQSWRPVFLTLSVLLRLGVGTLLRLLIWPPFWFPRTDDFPAAAALCLSWSFIPGWPYGTGQPAPASVPFLSLAFIFPPVARRLTS